MSSVTRRGHRAWRALAAVSAAAAVLTGGACSPAVAAARQQPGPLGHVGRWITDTTGRNVNLAKLRVMAEPYPRLVAGTPRAYAFHPGTRVFQLRYSTTGPGGRRFGPGSCTAVVVPPVQYPAGYRVTVDGGRVISRPDAGVLEIVSTGRAQVVTVVVRPGNSGGTANPGPVLPRCA